jgi:hypothetical protein
MKFHIIIVILCCALSNSVSVFAEQPESGKENSPEAQAIMEKQIDSLKQSIAEEKNRLELEEQKKLKFRAGLIFGIATPYGGVKTAEWIGESEVLSLDYRLTKNTFLYSEFIYCGYGPMPGEVIGLVYDNYSSPHDTRIKYDGKQTSRVYSYVLGYGFRIGSNYAKPSIRLGIGAIYNNTNESEFTVYNSIDTTTVPAYHAYSIGLDYMFGFELPLGVKEYGFFATYNVSSGIFGSEKGYKMQYTSMGFIGIYYRF